MLSDKKKHIYKNKKYYSSLKEIDLIWEIL